MCGAESPGRKRKVRAWAWTPEKLSPEEPSEGDGEGRGAMTLWPEPSVGLSPTYSASAHSIAWTWPLALPNHAVLGWTQMSYGKDV